MKSKSQKLKLQKQLKNLKVNDLIEIEWLDHFGESGWQTNNYINSQTLLPCKSVGYFVGYDKNSLKLAGTQDVNTQYNSVQHRIVSVVTKLTKLNRAGKLK